MTEHNEAPLGTAFTVSIEAREGVTTGISAADRSHTIQVAIAPDAKPSDLVQPGHVFPLRAKPGGVLERIGQTEAAVDLARLAGLNPAGVVCEIMNEDGTMARVPDLIPYCERHGLRMITVADLVEYRRRHEKLVERGASVRLPTEYGEFTAIAFRENSDRQGARRARPRRGRRRRERARARPLRVPDRRRLPLAALRLRRAARAGARPDRARGQRRPPLHGAGGSRDRPAEQAARLRAPGAGARHRRGEHASSASRPTRATTGSATRSSPTSG